MVETLNLFRNLYRQWKSRRAPTPRPEVSEIFRFKYACFRDLLDSNAQLLNIISDVEVKLQGQQIFGMSYVRSQATRAAFHAFRMVKNLDVLSGHRYRTLYEVLDNLNAHIKAELGKRKELDVTELVLPYARISKEMMDWVGGKNANLGEVLNRVGLPIPPGFAITTLAYTSFLAHNDLVDEINKRKMALDPRDPATIQQVAEEIQALIRNAEVPPALAAAIKESFDEMVFGGGGQGPSQARTPVPLASVPSPKPPPPTPYRGLGGERRGTACRALAGDAGEDACAANSPGPPLNPIPRVSLRSSAIGEDSELSYAGQYLSLLNVGPEDLLESYKEVVASLYTPRAMSYRLNKGIRDEDIAMSVACLAMVDSVASGVLYSRHPFNILEDQVVITAVWGLGPYAVEGVITPDTYMVAKDPDFPIVGVKVGPKAVQLRPHPEGGLREEPVSPERQNEPCLTPEQIRTLAGYALKLEAHYQGPQDVEWALDGDGRLLILQTRPLRLEAPPQGTRLSIPRVGSYEVLVESGAVAFPGVGCGPACHVEDDADLLSFPEGGVLVAKHSSPKFVLVMPKAQAIVTDSGSVAGHMAAVAREFGVPTLLDAKEATAKILPGMEVTVDAYAGRVYRGRVPELLELARPRESHMEATPVYQTLKRVAEYLIPLHLLDPRAPNFAPEFCESLHDLGRLVHELSYREMFQISDLVSDRGEGALKLEAPIPLDLHIINLGDGLTRVAPGAGQVTVDQIASVPLHALLKGMMHEGLQALEPRPVQFSGFFSVMREQMLSPQVAERFGERSYAIISEKYLNFSSRVGYHYSILDAYCGKTVNKNYITFSFKGGAADDVRRHRRVRAIAGILRSLDFTVEVTGDRVDARVQKYECAVIAEKLELVGRLLQFTRQMDMLMTSEASVEAVTKNFLAGNYRLEAEVFGEGG